ncbi:TPA: hypothetical protein ACJ2XP_004771 [Enterobacter cloacae]
MKARLNALLLAGWLCAGAALADTVADTGSDCQIENNELKCRVLNDVRPARTTNYPAGRTVRMSIPNDSNAWPDHSDDGTYQYPAQSNRRVTVLSEAGLDVTRECPLAVNLTHWVSEADGRHWAGADTTAWMEANYKNYNRYSRSIWWAGELTRMGDIARCPRGQLTVRLSFIPAITHQSNHKISGYLPALKADFQVLNLKDVSLRVPPTVGLTLSGRGAAGAGMITLRRWGDVSMEVARADDGGEPSLNSPSGSTTVPLDVTLDTLSGRLNVVKGSTDNVIRWDGRAGENGYRLNIATKGDVKKQLTEEPGTWRSTLRVTVNAL